MMEYLTSSLYFGLVLTIGIYVLAVIINKKWKVSLTSPLLLATVGVIAFLLLFDIPYSTYQSSGKYLYYFLVPATVCFAIPVYKQIKLISKHKWTVIISILFGGAVSVTTVVLLCWAFGLGDVIRNSMAAVSVTAPIAVGITEELGGLIGIAAVMSILTGILGNAVGKQVSKMLGLKSAIARGLAIGTSSHAAGTARALEMGPVEGAMASLSIVIAGLTITILAPLILWLFG